jgi:hypothetical protein
VAWRRRRQNNCRPLEIDWTVYTEWPLERERERNNVVPLHPSIFFLLPGD